MDRNAQDKTSQYCAVAEVDTIAKCTLAFTPCSTVWHSSLHTISTAVFKTARLDRKPDTGHLDSHRNSGCATAACSRPER